MRWDHTIFQEFFQECKTPEERGVGEKGERNGSCWKKTGRISDGARR